MSFSWDSDNAFSSRKISWQKKNAVKIRMHSKAKVYVAFWDLDIPLNTPGFVFILFFFSVRVLLFDHVYCNQGKANYVFLPT